MTNIKANIFLIVMPYLDAPQYHSSSCPCPMQSCPKNAHTGTGPTHKGPVSAINTIALAENIPKTPAVVTTCKIENILMPIKPENREKGCSDITSDLHPTKVFESTETTTSLTRGSMSLQIPPTQQHEAVQHPECNLNISSDSLSQRKQPRVGKSMERERQQQQHINMCGTDDVPQFKQEFSVKKEGNVKKEKDCEEVETFINMSVKIERQETVVASKEVETTDTVNLVNESGDECVDYSTKRKLDCSDDVIELSDNSTVDPPSATLKRRKLLSLPVNTPKRSPPNSYKSLIKQSPASNPPPTSKSKLISSTINRMGSKAIIKRRNILKSKSALKKLRLAAKAKKRAQKKKTENESDKSTNEDGIVDDIKADSAVEALKKSEESIENENNEDKSMDGSSEYSGKSNIDLTIDRVAKGYFSESDIFSCLSKHRKTKSQKKFDAKVLKASKNLAEKARKKSKVNKEAIEIEVPKTNKLKKTIDSKKKSDEGKKKPKKTESIEKDPLSLDEVPSPQTTPKGKLKVLSKSKKIKEIVEIVEEVTEPLAVVESDDDEKTAVTVETRDEETSTTVLSSAQTNKSTLDEADVANNNNECFEDNNRQKQQESLTLYKTPGVGWTTYNKPGKRGKKAKGKKHKLTLNDIIIPKSTSIPRWSNGWVWEGEPFQALVFLNVS